MRGLAREVNLDCRGRMHEITEKARGEGTKLGGQMGRERRRQLGREVAVRLQTIDGSCLDPAFAVRVKREASYGRS